MKTLIIFLMIFTLNCSKDSPHKSNKIRLGVPPFAGFLPVFMIKNNKELNKINLEMIVSEDVNNMYLKKELDIVCTTFVDAIQFHLSGHQTSIIYQFNHSLKSDLFIANKNIKSISDLRGKRIGVEGINSSSHVFLITLLEQAGIHEGEYYVKNVIGKDIPWSILLDEIDAGHTRFSHLKELNNSSNSFSILGQSGNTPGLLADVLAIDYHFSLQNKESVGKIIQAIIIASEEYRKNNSILEQIDIPGRAIDDIKEEISYIRFLTLDDNLKAFQTSEKIVSGGGPTGQQHFIQMKSISNSLRETGESILLFYEKRGQLYKKIQPELILNSEYLNHEAEPK